MKDIINRVVGQDIIVTVGPSSYNSFSIQRMDELGATCFRINLSHTELQDFVPILEKMEDWTEKPICPDTQGYQFRPRNVSAFTDKDLEVFRASKGLNVHTVFLSFCSYPEDVTELRSYFEYDTTVIAKIENAEGLRNLPSILEVADGILIDRGDLSKDVPLEKIRYIGNAACAGAELALLSREKRKRTIDIAKNTQYFEIATHPDFHDQYAENMLFDSGKK